MERLDPLEFSGPRGYFTEIDPKVICFKRNVNQYQIEVERKLKLSLLSKGFIVCAASHMANKYSYELFSDNSVLLEKNLVIPALRTDKSGISDYFLMDTSSGQEAEMIDFFTADVNKVVSWDFTDNTEWFKRAIIESLKDDKSVIYPNLSEKNYLAVQGLIPKIENYNTLSREDIIKLISTWPQGDKIVLLDYINLLYHLSGSRVVNCESMLPRESYIDYSLSDYAKKRTNLSDVGIFVKLIFEIGFESICGNRMPIEMLDLLTFEDIYHMAKPIRRSTFRLKYDNFISSYLDIYYQNNPNVNETLRKMDELTRDYNEIARIFSKVLDEEKDEYMKDRHRRFKNAVYYSTASLFASFLGNIPIISNLSNAPGITKSALALICNLHQLRTSKREMKDYSLYLKNRQSLLYDLLDNYQINENYVFIDTIRLFGDTLGGKITLK
jgi:hypothetical protein